MPDWEEWEDYYNDNYYGTTKPPIIIMPSLRSLEIEWCPRLKALPNYILQNSTLRTLQIHCCNLLEQRYNKERGEDWYKISHISHVVVKRR
uniref:Disease resistance protein RGA2-like n=1 Tax=Rhizophora mucronata TaxID=61149 RepID=A0A2P2LUQ4_RHIMU